MQPAALPLRDIHLPESIGWWPPAVGWWLLCVLVLLSVIGVFLCLRYRRRVKYSVPYQARQVLQQLRLEYDRDGDFQALSRELSALLRRVCISLFPRQQTAGLTGEDWLSFLDQCMTTAEPERPFSRGIGRVLLEAPYCRPLDINGNQLLSLCHCWLVAVSTQAKRQ
jgi:hypothetical protein